MPESWKPPKTDSPKQEGRDLEKSEAKKLLYSLEATGEYLFHGSPVDDIEEFEPRQPYNWENGKHIKHGPPAVAASPFADIAIFHSILFQDTTSFGVTEDGELTFKATQKALERGREHTGYVYVFRKDDFKPFGDGKVPFEWRSDNPVRPLRIVEVSFRDLPEHIQIVSRRESITKEKPPIAIEPASPSDASEIVRIQAETWLATYPNEEHGVTRADIEAKKLNDPSRIERWKTRIEDETGMTRIWVARKDKRVIGYCLAKKGDEENYIDALYVLPEEQTKGVGQQLMSEALSWLDASKPIGLGVAAYNAKAIAFYEKLGFQKSEEAPEPVPPLPSGKRLPIIKMVRRTEKNLKEVYPRSSKLSF